MQIEPELRALAREIAWPPTPALRPELAPRRRELRRPLLAAVALALAAVAAALAVPQSRAAILRFFHLGAATVQVVERLPATQERPLGAGLGPRVSTPTARAALQGDLLLPPLTPPPPLRAKAGAVSMLFRYRGAAVLLSEVHDADGVFLKKLAGPGTHVRQVRVGTDPGLWLSGATHVFVFPDAPPRLAHDVLIWHDGLLTLRLEGRHLAEGAAKALARSLSGREQNR
jgi:hypothetical protein